MPGCCPSPRRCGSIMIPSPWRARHRSVELRCRKPLGPSPARSIWRWSMTSISGTPTSRSIPAGGDRYPGGAGRCNPVSNRLRRRLARAAAARTSDRLSLDATVTTHMASHRRARARTDLSLELRAPGSVVATGTALPGSDRSGDGAARADEHRRRRRDLWRRRQRHPRGLWCPGDGCAASRLSSGARKWPGEAVDRIRQWRISDADRSCGE